MQKADQGAIAIRALMKKRIEQAYIDQVAAGVTDFIICVVQEDSSTVWVGTPSQGEFVKLMRRLGRPEAARVLGERASPATYWLFVVSLSGAVLTRPTF